MRFVIHTVFDFFFRSRPCPNRGILASPVRARSRVMTRMPHTALILFLVLILIIPIKSFAQVESFDNDMDVEPTACQKACTCLWDFVEGGHQLAIGPEIFYVQRKRHGGTKQDGWLYGARGTYDRIKPCALYWGIDAVGAAGTLSGRTSKGDKLKSTFIDLDVELRIGYNIFLERMLPCFIFSPYVSGGYFKEQNNFGKPSPIHAHFSSYSWYVGTGFLSTFLVTDQIDVGLNGKFKYMLQLHNRITHDREVDDFTLKLRDGYHYRIELPITYWLCAVQERAIRLTPFFEYRRHARLNNFPFDFLETKYYFYGFTLQFLRQF